MSDTHKLHNHCAMLLALTHKRASHCANLSHTMSGLVSAVSYSQLSPSGD